MTEPIYNVLFLCTGNTARSILAESMLRKDGAGRFNSFSAGSQPKGVINPYASKPSKPTNIRLTASARRAGTSSPVQARPSWIFIFTVCDNAAGEACPIWPGQPMTAHWGIEDPAAVEGSDIEKQKAFNLALRYMKTRISLLLATPIVRLDKLALKNRLREIGEAEGATHIERKSDHDNHDLSQPRLRNVAQHAGHHPQQRR